MAAWTEPFDSCFPADRWVAPAAVQEAFPAETHEEVVDSLMPKDHRIHSAAPVGEEPRTRRRDQTCWVVERRLVPL